MRGSFWGGGVFFVYVDGFLMLIALIFISFVQLNILNCFLVIPNNIITVIT